MTRRHHSDPIRLTGLDAWIQREPDQGDPPPAHAISERSVDPWGQPLPDGAVCYRCNCGASFIGERDDADDAIDAHVMRECGE